MFLILFYLVVGFEKNKDSILVCYSEKTSKILLDLFSDYPKTLNLSSKSTESQALTIDYIYILIDITKDFSFYTKLDQLSQQFNAFYITITPPSGQTSSSLRYHLHPGLDQLKSAISRFLDYLNWEEFSIFGSNQLNDQLLAFDLHSNYNQLIKSFRVYEDDITDKKSDEIVRKLIKTQGVKNLIVIDDGDSLISFQKSLKFRKIPKFGTYLIFLNRGIYTVDIEGALIISEPGTENSTSEETFEYITIVNFLKDLCVISTDSLKIKCPSQNCFKHFNLVNIQQAARKVIGTIENAVDIIEQPVFPENNTSIIPTFQKSKILMSIANGTSEIYNQGYIPTYAYFYQGARYAVARSNSLQEFDNFELDLFPTNCGNLFYDEAWYKMCLGSALNNLGVAYLTCIPTEGARGNLLTLRALSKNIPQISPLAISKDLENRSTYPEFLKLGVEEEFYGLSSIRILQNLRWNDIILFVSDNKIYLNVLTFISEYLKDTKIKIINPPHLRIFPKNYTRDEFDQYKEYFEFAKKSRCRIYYIFSSVTRFIIEGLYDVGLRKGDVIVISDSTLINALKEDVEDKFMKKRSELLAGSLIAAYKEWEGELGKQLKNEISGFFNDISYMCLTYDTVSVVKNAIMHLISIGEDFEDPSLLIETMRTQKFVGCMGNVYFKNNANNRMSYLISYKQIAYNQTTEKYTYEEFSTINPFSTQVFHYVNDPYWPTGENYTPSNYIEYSECGFDSRLVTKSEKGQIMIFIFSSIFLIFCITFSFLSWLAFKNNFKELEDNKEKNLNDYFFILFYVFELFEFVSLGPKNGIFSYAFKKTEFLLAIDLSNYFDFNFEKFWALYMIVLSVAFTFVFLSLLIFLIRTQMFLKYYFLSKLQDLSNSVLPIIGHIGFLPMISLLMNVFICEEGIGKDLEESYLERDCSQFCYKGKHKQNVVAGTIAAISFISTACFLRPYFESIQYSLNLSTKTWYLSVLSVIQTLCVFCRKCFKGYSEALPGFIISAFLGILIVITAAKKPYNYSRAVIYQLTVLAMALWVLLLSSIFVLSSGISVMIPIFFIGFFLIFLLGFLVSIKHPRIFRSDEVNTIPGLIRFQFTGKIEYIKDFYSQEVKCSAEILENQNRIK